MGKVNPLTFISPEIIKNDWFRGNRSSLNHLNLPNIRSKILRRSFVERYSNFSGSENVNLTPERLGLVGETDATSFNVGRAANGVKPATSSAVANAKKVSLSC